MPTSGQTSQSFYEITAFNPSPTGVSSQVFLEGLGLNSSPTGQSAQTFLESMASNASPTGVVPQVILEVIAASTPAPPTLNNLYVVGGWSPTTLTQGFDVLAGDPFVLNQMMAIQGSHGTIYATALSGAPNFWSPTTGAVSGLSPDMVSANWTPNGNFIFAADTTNGKLQVLAYSAGNVSLSQTLTIAGVLAAVSAGDSLHGLVAAGAGGLLPINFVSGWAVTGSFLAPSFSLLPLGTGATRIAVGQTAAVAFYDLVANNWSTHSSVAVTAPVLDLSTDLTGNIYAVCANSFFVIGPDQATIIGSGTFAGSLGDSFAYQEQLFITNPTSGTIMTYGTTSGAFVWTDVKNRAYPTGQNRLTQIGPTIFNYGPSGTSLLNFGKPYELKPNRTGNISIYNTNAATWTTLPLGPDHVPSCISLVSSGLGYAATEQNDLYTFNPSTMQQLASGIVPQHPLQSQSIPLGTSVLMPSGASLYAANSMAGSLIQVF